MELPAYGCSRRLTCRVGQPPDLGHLFDGGDGARVVRHRLPLGDLVHGSAQITRSRSLWRGPEREHGDCSGRQSLEPAGREPTRLGFGRKFDSQRGDPGPPVHHRRAHSDNMRLPARQVVNRALVVRTGLSGLVDIGSWAVTVRASGARLVVESADAASAYGHLPYLVVCDELAQWPTTRGAKALWEAVVSGLPKRRDSRLAVLTTAGDPVHWAAKVLDAARSSERWHVSRVPGPVPWADPKDLAEQARLLPASAYSRLHLNIWTAAEDRLVSP